jgi:hypothetical protein
MFNQENRKVAGGQVRHIGWEVEDNHIVFDKKFPGEK